MTFDERAEKLRRHPDTIEIEICGEPRPWFLGKLTFDLAKAKGSALGEVFAQLSTAGEDLGAQMDAFGRLVYAGLLPFDETIELDDVAPFLSVGDMNRMAPLLTGRLEEVAEEEQGKAEAQAQSKRDRSKR